MPTTLSNVEIKGGNAKVEIDEKHTPAVLPCVTDNPETAAIMVENTNRTAANIKNWRPFKNLFISCSLINYSAI